MLLTLQRLDGETNGELLVDGAKRWVTLELPLEVGGLRNVPKKTCIPASPEGMAYAVIKRYSRDFDRAMPHIEIVPDRTEIMLHWGNWHKDTLGCVLVGEVRVSTGPEPMIGESRAAFAQFEALCNIAWNMSELIFLEVLDA